MKIIKSLLSDMNTGIWFLSKPKFYFYFFFLFRNKFLPNKDSKICKNKSFEWCKKNQISINEFASKKNIKIYNFIDRIYSTKNFLNVIKKINSSKTNFGGSAYLDLVYSICECYKVINAIETGVAYGWSSSSILLSLSKRNGKLVSTDMPMMKQKNYELIGVAVSKSLQQYWKLIKEPDIYGLYKALEFIDYNYNFVHYDSDKSYYGRRWSFPKLYRYLNNGGVFISDDIQDNLYFADFVTKLNLEFYVIKFENKFVGIFFKK